jgi:hypothetical protein
MWADITGEMLHTMELLDGQQLTGLSFSEPTHAALHQLLQPLVEVLALIVSSMFEQIFSHSLHLMAGTLAVQTATIF